MPAETRKKRIIRYLKEVQKMFETGQIYLTSESILILQLIAGEIDESEQYFMKDSTAKWRENYNNYYTALSKLWEEIPISKDGQQ